MNKVSLSSIELNENISAVRKPIRSKYLRGSSFLEEFDCLTLFYDIFWRSDKNSIVLIGPPLYNLESELSLSFEALPAKIICAFEILKTGRCVKYEVTVPNGTSHLLLKTRFTEWIISPQDNMSTLFRNLRVIFTLNKNNNVQWIKDWVTYHCREHGCNAVLIYDNNSTIYDRSAISKAILEVDGIIESAVIPWDFKYGVTDWAEPYRRILIMEKFAQEAMLEHARHRFLSLAKSVLNVDVDELVLRKSGEGVFEAVEASRTGIITLNGVWVENNNEIVSETRRHFDFSMLRGHPRDRFEPKWAATPGSCLETQYWYIHSVPGKTSDIILDRLFELRHFKAINRPWNWHASSQSGRDESLFAGGEELIRDTDLAYSFRRVFGKECNSLVIHNAVGTASTLFGNSDDKRSELTAELSKQYDDAINDRMDQNAMILTAYNLYQAAKFAQSIQICYRILENDPRSLAAIRILYFGKRNSVGASHAELVNTINISLDKSGICDKYILGQAAEILINFDAFSAALSVINSAIETESYWQFYEIRARALFMLGRRQESAENYKKSLLLREQLTVLPKGWEYPPIDVGLIFGSLNSLYQKFNIPIESLMRLAEMSMTDGNTDMALEYVNSISKLNPSDPFIYMRYLELIDQKKQPELYSTVKSRVVDLIDGLLEMVKRYGMNLRPGRWMWEEFEAQSQLARIFRLLTLKSKVCGVVEVLAEAADIYAWLSRHFFMPELLKFEYGMYCSSVGKNMQAAELMAAACRRQVYRGTMQIQFAEALIKAGQRAEALRVLGAAAQRLPDHARVQADFGKLLHEEGRHSEALIPLGRAVLLNPDNRNAHCNLAATLIKVGDRSEALRVLGAAAQRLPDHARVQADFGKLLHEEGRHSEALIPLGRAVLLNPDNGNAHCNLAATLIKVGDRSEALRVLGAAAQRLPDHARVQADFGKLLHEEGRHSEALIPLGRAVLLNPDNGNAHCNLAAALIKVGDRSEALRVLGAAAQRLPDHARVQADFGKLLHEEGRHSEALIPLGRAVLLNPDNGNAHCNLAAALIKVGDRSEALRVLGAAAQRLPDHARVQADFGKLLHEEGRHSEALIPLGRAVLLNPDNGNAHCNLAAALIKVGDRSEALRVLGAAAQRLPDHARVQADFGKLLHEEGRHKAHVK